MTAVRLAWRGWRRRPLHPIAIFLLLTVGIAGNAIVFMGVESLLISPLAAVDRPESLVSFGRLSIPNYRSFSDRLDGVAEVAAFFNSPLTLTGEAPESVRGAFVSGNYFAVLGVTAVRGRTFDVDSTAPARATDARTAVISERFWRTAYAADPAVIGRPLWLNDVAATVIGVAPGAFRGTTLDYVPDVWVPLSLQAEVRPDLADLRENRMIPRVTVIARRSNDTSSAGLDLAVTRLVDALVAEYPRDNDRPSVRGIAAVSLAQTAFDPDRREGIGWELGLLQLAVAAVFLICLANVIILTLVTAEARRSEFAVRLVHGARWWRIVRHQTVEYLLLGGLAGLCGIAAASAAIDLLTRLRIVPPMEIGPWTLALVAGLGLASPVATGTLVGFRVRRMEAIGALHSLAERRGATTRSTLMHVFLAVQVALSLALVCSTLLLVQNLQHRLRMDHGFESAGVLSVRLPLSRAGYTETTTGTFRRDVVREVAALPGVRRASWACSVPFNGITLLNEVVSGRGSQDDPSLVIVNYVDRHFFATMGIPIVRGQGFSEDERWQREVVVSQRLAAILWRGGDPVGRRLRTVHDNRLFDVVGVVGDVRYRDPETAIEPMVYFPPNDAVPSAHLLVQTDVPPSPVVAAVQARIKALDARVLTHDAKMMHEFIDALLSRDRRAAAGTGLFGAIGLMLVGLGLYGAAARLVGLRQREIGVRLAIGGRPRDMCLLLLGEAGIVAVCGAVAGVGTLLGGWRLVRNQIPALDATGLVGALGVSLLVLGGVVVLAVLAPCRRAMAVDPAISLRAE